MTNRPEILRALAKSAHLGASTFEERDRVNEELAVVSEALDDSVPREDYNLVGRDCRDAEDERDALAALIHRTLNLMGSVPFGGGEYGPTTSYVRGIYDLLKTAPAVSLARHDAEVKAKALNDFSDELQAESGFLYKDAPGVVEARARAKAILAGAP